MISENHQTIPMHHFHSSGCYHCQEAASTAPTSENSQAGDRLTISCFSVVELIVARFSHSLALLTDFGHMLSDSFALGLALLATWIAQRSADKQGSFFSGRQEAIAAPIDGVGLVIMASWIAWEAVDSLQSPSMSSGCNAGNPTVPEKSDIADGYSQFANAGGGHY